MRAVPPPQSAGLGTGAGPQAPGDPGAAGVEKPATNGGISGFLSTYRGQDSNLELTTHSRPVPKGFFFTGYVQAQYFVSQLSQDEIQQSGATLNQNRFVVRRARLRLDRGWEYASGSFELDANTNNGPRVTLRRAEVAALYRGDNGDKLPPLVMVSIGMGDIPFGEELTESARVRVFMERSAASLGLFPSEPDIGARLSGAVSFFRYSLGVLNGEPLDEKTGRFAGDPSSSKDLVGRIGFVAEASSSVRIAGGTSFLAGQGFHAGTTATKNSVTWKDLNENGTIDQGEVVAAPGSSASPSKSFTRTAIGLDLKAKIKTPLGPTNLAAEFVLARNLDRAQYVADPVVTGVDIRELGYYVSIVQNITRYGLVGVRFDVYDPNSDFLISRAGKLLPSSARITTLSPIVGLILPDQGRLTLQYDWIRDSLAKDGRGVPTDLKNNQLTLRAQVDL